MIAARSPPAPSVDEIPKTRDYLSFSAISLFQSCPLHYYFKYVLGLPERTVSASLIFGSALHASLQFFFEQLLAGNPAPTLDTLLDVYQDLWQTRYRDQTVRFGKGEDVNTLGQLADRMLQVFLASDFAQPTGTILAVEEELRGVLIPNCPDLLARVDLLLDTGDALVLSDFKTSRSAWSDEHVIDAASQLLLYSELVKPLADGKPLRLQFAVLTKTKSPDLTLHPVSLDSQQVARTKSVVNQVWNAIQAENYYPNPSPLNCATCPYRRPCQLWPEKAKEDLARPEQRRGGNLWEQESS